MSNEEQIINRMIQYFQYQGGEGNRIQASNQFKRPDMSVNFENEITLIELKQKGDNPEQIENEKSQLELSGESTTRIELPRRNVISGLIDDAVGQLNSNEFNNNEYKVVWLHSEGEYAEQYKTQALNTIYGKTGIFDLDGNNVLKECFYFHFPDFAKHSVLDGVILSNGDQACLCLNSLGTRYKNFKESLFAKAFGSAILDPNKLEEDDEALVINPFDFVRNDFKCVQKKYEYLRSEYNLGRINHMDFNMMGVQIRIDT